MQGAWGWVVMGGAREEGSRQQLQRKIMQAPLQQAVSEGW